MSMCSPAPPRGTPAPSPLGCPSSSPLWGHPGSLSFESSPVPSQPYEDAGAPIPSSQGFTPLSHHPILARLESSQDRMEVALRPWLATGTEMTWPFAGWGESRPHLFLPLLPHLPLGARALHPRRVCVCAAWLGQACVWGQCLPWCVSESQASAVPISTHPPASSVFSLPREALGLTVPPSCGDGE